MPAWRGAAIDPVRFALLVGPKDQPAFNVSTTPVNRDARLGTSFAPIVKKVAPSVVNIYSTRFIKERPMRNPLFNDPFFRQFFGDQSPGRRP